MEREVLFSMVFSVVVLSFLILGYIYSSKNNKKEEVEIPAILPPEGFLIPTKGKGYSFNIIPQLHKTMGIKIFNDHIEFHLGEYKEFFGLDSKFSDIQEVDC